ncbi:hypothetical protein AN958_06339 [Leucoagaricus sp. SymC.cos]|nr:hypothetical protein AN958_06339 [Leucoagaricus sp. SymC.cos]
MSSLRNLLVRLLPTRYKDYELVASDSLQLRSLTQHYLHPRHVFRRVFTLRSILIAVPASLALLVAAILINGGVPALYSEVEGVKYLAFPGHIWGHGWNNVFQEYLMLSYLAYITNRSYVFDDYTWSHTPFPYTIYDFALRPARIPLNAFISGPTAGGSISPSRSSSHGTPSPRAVHTKFWESICPREKRRVLNAAEMPRDVWGSGKVDWWKNKITEYGDTRCLEIDTHQKEIFDFDFFGGQEILDVWPSLSKTPILSDFGWSPLVSSAVERNFVMLSDSHDSLAAQQSSPASSSASSQEDVYPALLAVHLRRGDFVRHCARLAEWGIYFTGFNSLKELPDPWISFNGSSHVCTHLPFSRYMRLTPSVQDEKKEYYRKRCYPTHEEIVERLHTIRAEHDDTFVSTQNSNDNHASSSSTSSSTSSSHHLRRVYVLSNAWPIWLDGLKHKLIDDGWEDVIFGGDLILDKEQKGVDVAVDMSIAERAEVFVGNGFSSVSGNIVMLRTAKGMDVRTNRLL